MPRLCLTHAGHPETVAVQFRYRASAELPSARDQYRTTYPVLTSSAPMALCHFSVQSIYRGRFSVSTGAEQRRLQHRAVRDGFWNFPALFGTEPPNTFTDRQQRIRPLRSARSRGWGSAVAVRYGSGCSGGDGDGGGAAADAVLSLFTRGGNVLRVTIPCSPCRTAPSCVRVVTAPIQLPRPIPFTVDVQWPTVFVRCRGVLVLVPHRSLTVRIAQQMPKPGSHRSMRPRAAYAARSRHDPESQLRH